MRERKLSKMGKALAGGIAVGTLIGCGCVCLMTFLMGGDCTGVLFASLVSSLSIFLLMWTAIDIGKFKQ